MLLVLLLLLLLEKRISVVPFLVIKGVVVVVCGYLSHIVALEAEIPEHGDKMKRGGRGPSSRARTSTKHSPWRQKYRTVFGG